MNTEFIMDHLIFRGKKQTLFLSVEYNVQYSDEVTRDQFWFEIISITESGTGEDIKDLLDDKTINYILEKLAEEII